MTGFTPWDPQYRTVNVVTDVKITDNCLIFITEPIYTMEAIGDGMGGSGTCQTYTCTSGFIVIPLSGCP